MSMFRKYGESLLDQPIGIEESRVRQQKEGDVRGSLQQEKRYQRVARRAYRQSMRDGNYGKAMDALDWIDGKSGGMEQGVMAEGSRMSQARNQPGNFTDQAPVAPGPGAAGPSEPSIPGEVGNLDGRLGLFAEMQSAYGRGESLAGFRERASSLGINDKEWSTGSHRAKTTKPSLDSPDFSSRLNKFGNTGASLLDAYNSFQA